MWVLRSTAGLGLDPRCCRQETNWPVQNESDAEAAVLWSGMPHEDSQQEVMRADKCWLRFKHHTNSRRR